MNSPASTSAVRTACKVMLGVALAGCAADSLVLPSEGDPALVSVVQGAGQQGLAGTALSESLAILITDGQNRPVVNQPVGFVLTGGGSVAPVGVVTDGDGTARFRWVLGPTAGLQSLEVGVSADGTLAPKTTVTAMAEPGPVNAIESVKGNGQTGQAGLVLPESLVVRLIDGFGNPVPGEDVTWHTLDGSLDRQTTTTDVAGLAAVSWTLGSTSGAQSATAAFVGANGSPVTFDATATPGAPPRLAVQTQPSSTAVSGVPFASQPSVRLETALGTPISQSGVSVTAAIGFGGGTLSGTTTVMTDANGLAQFTDLAISGASGSRTLIFAAPGHTAATSASILVSTPSPSASLSTVSASPSSMLAGSAASTITVTVRDDGGQPIAGVAVTIAVSGSGNTVNQPISTTNANGVATGSFSSSTAETKTVSAVAGGVAITQTATVTVTSAGAVPAASTTTAHVPNGKRFIFTRIVITSRDASGTPLKKGGFASQFQVSVTGANVSSPAVVDNGDGTYSASYLPLFKGRDQVAITFGGVPIKGSPYRSDVK